MGSKHRHCGEPRSQVPGHAPHPISSTHTCPTLMSTGARRFCRSFLCTQRKFISTSCTLSSLTRMVAGTPVMKATSFLLVLQQEEEGKAIAERAPANMHAHNGAVKVPGPRGATSLLAVKQDVPGVCAHGYKGWR
jgi:hypothetical protein